MLPFYRTRLVFLRFFHFGQRLLKMEDAKQLKKGKNSNNSLLNLPDDVLLIVFQFNTSVEIKKTHVLSYGFPSLFVHECTMSLDMRSAISAQNLHNMKWIKERYQEGNTKWSQYLNLSKKYYIFVYVFFIDHNRCCNWKP